MNPRHILRALMFATLPISTISTSHAAVLPVLPTPGEQGGMIHANVWFDGSLLHSYFDAGIPELKPLVVWSPGDTFDPSSPWFAKLDPSTGAGAFNSQYGLLIDGSLTDPLPGGSKIMVTYVAASTGIGIYRWRNNDPQLFEPILGTEGSPISWDWGALSHAMFHPMFVADPGTGPDPTVTLRFDLVDATTNEILPQYGGTQAVFQFALIPEPGTALMSAFALLLVARRNRRS